MTDPLRTFTAALPHRARQAFTLDHRTIRALHTLNARGDDITDLAARISRGLEHRPHADIRRLLTFRLLRTAGQLDDQEADT